jgi:hypothetical protein
MHHHHHQKQVNWYDYNQHNSTDGQYLSYFNTNVVPHRGRVKNPSIIPRIPKKSPTFKEPPKAEPKKEPPPPKGGIVKGKSQPATDQTIPEDVLMKARMAEASRIYSTDGQDVAQEYLDRYKIPYTIEQTLSSDISIVLINNNTGETIIAYRGTDITNAKDLITDALALFGKEKLSPEYGEVKEQLEAVQELYGTPSELVGFSRGSVLSMNLGNEYNIPTTELNPLISPNLVKEQETGSVHEIFRTQNDPVSFLAKGKSANSKWKIRSILPLKDTINPWDEHTLRQLLTNDTPRRTSVEELLNNRIVEQGARVSEYTMMNEMLTHIEDHANFTRYMEQVNPADAVLSQTQRVYEGSNYTELWTSLGGTFSPEEALAISQNQVGASKPFETTAAERTGYSSLDPAERQSVIDTAMENMQNTLETSAKFSADPNTVREALVKETTLGGTSPEISAALVEGLHPVSQLKGLAGGLAGYEEAGFINKLSGGALGNAGVATVGGALGAVNTSLATAALAGSTEALTATVLLPEIVAGAAGGIAGYETSVAVAQALKDAGANEDTIKSVSAISGGAVGGGVTAAVGVGASVAAAALTGGEIGAAFAPETLGVSVAIGVGIGAVVGGASYVVGKAEEATSALKDEIFHPKANPYYVPPDYNSSDPRSVMAYLQRKDQASAQQQQDQSQGITPEQRIAMNNFQTPTPPIPKTVVTPDYGSTFTP